MQAWAAIQNRLRSGMVASQMPLTTETKVRGKLQAALQMTDRRSA